MLEQTPAREWVTGLLGATAIALVIGVLRLAQAVPNPVIAALLLLLVVLAAAAAATLRAAITLALCAMVAFNYFLLPPFHTLALANPQDWIVLVVFVAVAVVASHLSTTARDRRIRGEALRQRVELASALLASFSHDLRTPLTAIRLAVGNLQDSHTTAGERREQGRVALAAVDRLTRLFEQTLDMARIDARAVTAERQWVTPADLVEAAVAYVGSPLDERDLVIHVDTRQEALVDPRLTSRALAHVLENAAAHAPEGAIQIEATADGVLKVSVRDHGPGIPEPELERLEAPFQDRPASRATRHGLGLGLAIARGLLAAQGGLIHARNVEDGGARVDIEIPATIRATAEE